VAAGLSSLFLAADLTAKAKGRQSVKTSPFLFSRVRAENGVTFLFWRERCRAHNAHLKMLCIMGTVPLDRESQNQVQGPPLLPSDFKRGSIQNRFCAQHLGKVS